MTSTPHDREVDPMTSVPMKYERLCRALEAQGADPETLMQIIGLVCGVAYREGFTDGHLKARDEPGDAYNTGYTDGFEAGGLACDMFHGGVGPDSTDVTYGNPANNIPGTP